MKIRGFTLIEILIIVAFISILLAMGISITSKFAARRSIDDITYKISSALNTARLRASRSGVEFEAHLDLNGDSNILTITTFRGTSNTGSDKFLAVNSLDLRISNDYTIVPSSHEFQFNPNGTAGLPKTIKIRPSLPDTKIKKCGKIVVSPLGRIRTATGNWDWDWAICNTIGDRQDNNL